MRYVALFDDFNQMDESYSFDQESLLEAKINQMVMLKEGCTAAWEVQEFIDFFSPVVNTLNESASLEDKELLLEKAYHTYELGVLYENKKEWFEDNEKIHYLVDQEEDDQKVILFKNNQLHFIQKESLEAVQRGELITEGLFGSIGNFFGNVYAGAKSLAKKAVSAVKTYVIEPVKKAASWVADKAKKAWEFLSDGAIKIWNFCKKIYSAVAAFASENPLTAIGIGLQILATVVGFIPVAGQAIAGVLLMIAGGITIYEGGSNIIKASKEVGKADKVVNIVKGGAKIVMGTASTILGVRDVVMAAAEAASGTGGFGLALKSSVVGWSTKFTKTAFGGIAAAGAGKALGCSAWLGEFFQTLCAKAPFMSNLATKSVTKYAAQGLDAAKGSGQDAVLANSGETDSYQWDQRINEDSSGSWGFGEIIVNFLAYIGNACFSWLYNTVVSGISKVGSAIKSLLNLPGNISKSIDRLQKNADGWISRKIAGALSYVVKPLTNCAQGFIDKYVKPTAEPIANWMVSLGKRSKGIIKAINGNPKLKSPVSGLKKEGPKEIPKQEVKLTSADKKNIAKIGDKGTKTMVKAGGGSQKLLKVMDKRKEEFTKKFPGVAKIKGSFGESKSGTPVFTYKSGAADGYVTLFNNARYFVLDGPNKGAKGDFKSEKNKIVLIQPKGGFKKNESRSYVMPIDEFLNPGYI